MKTCSTCKVPKILDDFYKQADGYMGRHASCKDCRKEYGKRTYDPIRDREKRLRFSYGIGIEDYERMLEAQNFRCAICQSLEERLHVDHDHVTGKVRGLLCNACNTGIGLLRDSKSILRSAIDYLENTG